MKLPIATNYRFTHEGMVIEYNCDSEIDTIEIQNVFQLDSYDMATGTGLIITHEVDLNEIYQLCEIDFVERENERIESLLHDEECGLFND